MASYTSLPCAIVSLLSAICCSLILSQSASASEQVSLPWCLSTCGNLTIPYPFGIGTQCAREGFNLTCNDSSYPVKTFIGTGNVEVLNISLLPAEVKVKYIRGYDYNTPRAWAGDERPYTFSNVRNRFTVIGCDTYAYIYGKDGTGFSGGCMSRCDRLDQVVNGSCSGIGCCQAPIPKGLKYYKISVNSFHNHTKVSDFNPCSYAFLVDQDWFTFQSVDITDKSVYRYNVDKVPLVFDWVAGNESCAEASRNTTTFACRSQNSYCYHSNSSATGYLCNCSTGYEGNPYLDDGCQGVVRHASSSQPKRVNAQVEEG